MKISNTTSLDDIQKLLYGDLPVIIDEEASRRVSSSFEFLERFSIDKVIYGINTGAGPMTQHRIEPDGLLELQFNFILSHSCGASDPLPEVLVRSAMFARLKSLCTGYSGVHPYTTTLLAKLINYHVTPYVPSHGGVGASGDLVQLAHIALVMIGKGEVFYKGKLCPTSDVFRELSLVPMTMYIREGLALLNGTSFMTGVALVNLIQAHRLVWWMTMSTAILSEIVMAFDDYYSPELNGAKHHEGQRHVAAQLASILQSSGRVKNRSVHLYKKIEKKIFKEKVQEYYSIRCVPQILGPIFDTLVFAEKVILHELESANDNPIIDVATQNVYHGGNFHGDYVSLEMDKLKIAITKLSLLSERQINFLMNDKLNSKLPPFVNLGTLGLNLGMQGVQFTAVSTTAENQTLSYPMYLHTISNNNDNQDIVSMGTNSALIARKVIENTFEVVMVELMALVQAVDYLGLKEKMSKETGNVYDKIRNIFPAFVEDKPKYRDMEKIKNFLMYYELPLSSGGSRDTPVPPPMTAKF